MTHDDLFTDKVPEAEDRYWVREKHGPDIPIPAELEGSWLYLFGNEQGFNPHEFEFGPAIVWPPTWEMRRVEGPPPPSEAAYCRAAGKKGWFFAWPAPLAKAEKNIVEHIPLPLPPVDDSPLTDAELDSLAAQGGDAARAVEEIRKLRSGT